MGRVGQRREGSSDRKLALTFDRGSWQVFREFAQTVPSVIQLHRCNYSQKAGRQSNLTSQVFRPGLVNSVAAPPSDRPTRGNCHLVATLRISSSLEIEWRRFRPRSALPQDQGLHLNEEVAGTRQFQSNEDASDDYFGELLTFQHPPRNENGRIPTTGGAARIFKTLSTPLSQGLIIPCGGVA